MNRVENSLGPFIGYHGCDSKISEDVLAGAKSLTQSENSWDWLGSGIYFWADSPERGYKWAEEQSKRAKSKIKKPSVIGAFIYPGFCLNLTDVSINGLLIASYNSLKALSDSAKTPMPINDSKKNGIYMRRQLDCAVLNLVHEDRKLNNEQPFDTVYGVFEEGDLLYPGSGFREKTHIQIAVRNPKCIIGYFRTELT